MMQSKQWIAIAVAALLFLVIYGLLDRLPPERQAINEQRALAVEATDINALLQEARADLPPLVEADLTALEVRLEEASTDSARVEAFKALSSRWYRQGNPAIAGYYAQEVAELQETDEAWGIAGSTYVICLQRAERAKVRAYCTQRAVSAFEKAISLNPEQLDYRINLALVYTENPPEDNPMKGVLMLRTLNQAHPENVSVMNQLARLAIRTGQYEKALERLQRAEELQPDNRSTLCLLAEAYRASGQSERATAYAKRCSGEQTN